MGSACAGLWPISPSPYRTELIRTHISFVPHTGGRAFIARHCFSPAPHPPEITKFWILIGSKSCQSKTFDVITFRVIVSNQRPMRRFHENPVMRGGDGMKRHFRVLFNRPSTKLFLMLPALVLLLLALPCATSAKNPAGGGP